jgi:dihydroxyacetone kinase-like predicted kinase
MDEQHRDFLEMRKDRSPDIDTAIVAVVSGEGLTDVFRSLGVSAVVSGGQTMNPSTKEILQAVEKISAEKVIILPNNKNIIATAEQVNLLTEKKIEVVPTRMIPQGVAALLAFDYEADIQTNAEIMSKTLSSVRSIEITCAVRSTKVNGMQIKKKQPMGLLDGELVAVGNSFEDVIDQIMERLELDKAEVVTIYYGADVYAADAEQIGSSIRDNYSHLQIELVWGGQSHYHYIISIE